MGTKIKIRLSRGEYETVSVIIISASKTFCVDDINSLYIKEALEAMGERFLAKKYKSQKNYQFSFSLIETHILFTLVATTGAYEKAVCELIYNEQIAPQVQRAVQMRMGFK